MAIKNEDANIRENKIHAKNLYWIVCADTKSQEVRVIPFEYLSTARFVWFHNYDVDKSIFSEIREFSYPPKIKVLLDDSIHKLAERKISLHSQKEAQEGALKRVVKAVYPDFVDDDFVGSFDIYNHRILEDRVLSRATLDDAYVYNQKAGVPLFSPIIPLKNISTLTSFMGECCAEYLADWEPTTRKSKDGIEASGKSAFIKNDREH